MGVITTKNRGGFGGDHTYSQAEKLAMEMEMSFKAANLANFKELVFDSSGDLSNVSIYTDSGKATKLFNKDLTYDSSGDLSQLVLTRITDSVVLTKDFSYDGDGNLSTINNVVS
tara:strand:- start:1052 stop:1393 length:342 start_codon:yes stop_codon:yes gene_type:complete